MAAIMSDISGHRFRTFRVGGIVSLGILIRLTRLAARQPNAIFPPWQGMQYLRDIFGGQARLAPIDNTRYPDLKWTSVREVLATRR